jgi:hypothetical protein
MQSPLKTPFKFPTKNNRTFFICQTDELLSGRCPKIGNDRKLLGF